MKMRMWLDDIRQMPDDYDIWVKTAFWAIEMLQTFPNITHLSFDHDLGSKETGYDVAKFIELMASKNNNKRITWDIHSSNPVGRKNIEMAMKSAERFWKINEEKNR
jgi:hypothetical protein